MNHAERSYNSGTSQVSAFDERKASYVYFIQEGVRGAIKIGWANDPAARMASLQTANPRRLRALGLISGGPYDEMNWHMRFKDTRLSGEWFKRTNELVAAIKAERTHILLEHPRDGRTTRRERIVPAPIRLRAGGDA
jgi:adenine deaminase